MWGGYEVRGIAHNNPLRCCIINEFDCFNQGQQPNKVTIQPVEGGTHLACWYEHLAPLHEAEGWEAKW